MSPLNKVTILHALSSIVMGRDNQPLSKSKAVSGVRVKEGAVSLVVEIPKQAEIDPRVLEQRAGDAIRNLAGVESVNIVVSGDVGGVTLANQSAPPRAPIWDAAPLVGVKQVLAVASGKGGVGKSTTTLNLARALKEKGLRVGILDADIYGPSMPQMLSLKGKPELSQGGKMIPLIGSDDIPCMSIGFLVDGEEAVIWRASMVTRALRQLLRGTQWPDLDMLLVDMPPGTGDVQLTLMQAVPLTGAVIVTTPQEVSRIDAAKCLQTFRKTGVPVLGIVENMSGLFDVATGEMIHVFGEGGGEKLSQQYGAPLLGCVPLDPEICRISDACGTYQLQDEENSPQKLYSKLAETLLMHV